MAVVDTKPISYRLRMRCICPLSDGVNEGYACRKSGIHHCPHRKPITVEQHTDCSYCMCGTDNTLVDAFGIPMLDLPASKLILFKE